MLSIVGTRIYMKEGDHCAFKVMYENNDDLFNFESNDSLTMVIRKISNGKEVLVKKSESIRFDNEPCSVFIFSPGEIDKGDYLYELILNSHLGHQHTLIDKAHLNILKSSSYTKKDPDPDLTQTVYPDKVCLHTHPLVCNFRYDTVDKTEAPGTLILYDKELGEKLTESHGTLILYDEDMKKKADTLILF